MIRLTVSGSMVWLTAYAPVMPVCASACGCSAAMPEGTWRTRTGPPGPQQRPAHIGQVLTAGRGRRAAGAGRPPAGARPAAARAGGCAAQQGLQVGRPGGPARARGWACSRGCRRLQQGLPACGRSDNARGRARAGLTKTVALETAREEQVTCNAICPGYVLTDLVRNQLEDTSRARGIPVVRGPRPAAPFFMPAQRQPCSHARCKGAPPRARDARVARVPARARKNCHGGPSGHRTRPGAARPHELQAVAEHPQACSTAACRSLTRLVRRSPGGGRRIGAGCGPMTAARPPAARRTR